MDTIDADVLIIGAGIAGLIAAQRLHANGFRVVVLEKDKQAGGRLATRTVGQGRADSGAQFFTVRSAIFQPLVRKWLEEGVVYEWSRGWSDGSLLTTPPDGYPRFAAYGGFERLVQRLAQGADIRIANYVAGIGFSNGTFNVTQQAGEPLRCRGVIVTAPVPQALRLFNAGGVRLPEAIRQSLETIQYAPCLCGLFAIRGDTNLPEPGVLQRPGESISWIADNERKGISSGGRVLTVHANRDASYLHWSLQDEVVLAWMLEEIKPWLRVDVEIIETRLERWDYAVPTNVYPAPYLLGQHPGPFAFSGDAFDGPRVEGAALSGLAAADAISLYL